MLPQVSIDLQVATEHQPCVYLFILPAEIRNLIYEYCAINYTTEVTLYSPFRGYSLDYHQYQPPTAPLQIPALLQTCQKIAHEARPILYANVRLRFRQSGGSIMWVWACGAPVLVPSAVRNLHLELDASSCEPAISFLRDLFLRELRGGRREKDTTTTISFGEEHLQSVRVCWSNNSIPRDALESSCNSPGYTGPCHFWRPVVEFLACLKGLRMVEIVGDYDTNFIPCAEDLLGAAVAVIGR